MLDGRLSLEEYLTNERRGHPEWSGELNSLIFAAARACKVISNRVAAGRLALDPTREALATPGALLSPAAGTDTGEAPADGELAAMAEHSFLHLLSSSGKLAATLSPRQGRQPLQQQRVAHAPAAAQERYLFCFDPLENSGNLQRNAPAGSLFSILRTGVGGDSSAPAFLQAGTAQVCAGYALYGPATLLVLSVGNGTQGFTLDPVVGEFVHTHPNLRIPDTGRDFAINPSHYRHWDPAIRRYVDESVTGEPGAHDHGVRMRWMSSLVAETHNVLLRGGACLIPFETEHGQRAERVNLLYHANPIAFLVEQAGGAASTGNARIMGLAPRDLHEEVSLFFGARAEVERIERYHEETTDTYDAPLFSVRGLFRD